jgi:riboflavin kinase/FMN adenylyltransferase
LTVNASATLKVYDHVDAFTGVESPVMTTGTFDGVHTGHQVILERLRQIASETGGESVLFTFEPHPRRVLFPEDDRLRLLNTREEKIKRVEAAGIDHLIIHPFTLDFARLSAFDYVRDILVTGIGVQTMVVGYDHRFGKNREGDFNTLREFAEMFSFRVEEIPAQMIDNVNVSSTKVRKALAEGDVETASGYLSYNYPLSGVVIQGDGIGREIGFPTANLRVNEPLKLIPADGVYAVRVKQPKGWRPAMMNIGNRPTVTHDGERRLEVHLIDSEEDLYGTELQIEFVRWLRPEHKFDSLEALTEQLTLDRQLALEALL